MYRTSTADPDLVIVFARHLAFALDAATGMPRWAYALKVAPVRAVVAGSRVYVAGDRELACLDVEKGTSHFHVATPFEPDVSLYVDRALESDRIFVGAAGKVGCYDARGGMLWQADLKVAGGVGFALPSGATQIDLS